MIQSAVNYPGIPALYLNQLLGDDTIIRNVYVTRLTAGETLSNICTRKCDILAMENPGLSVDSPKGYNSAKKTILTSDVSWTLNMMYPAKALVEGAIRIDCVRPAIMMTEYGFIASYDVWLVEYTHLLVSQ